MIAQDGGNPSRYTSTGLGRRALDWLPATAPEPAVPHRLPRNVFLAAAFASAVAGCAINQHVSPVERLATKEVCVVENPAVVQERFMAAYRRALQDKGYTVRTLPAGSAMKACPATSTYTAYWRQDFAPYLAFIELQVFTNGQPSGFAQYDSQGGNFNRAKYIQDDEKVSELVNKLFPSAP